MTPRRVLRPDRQTAWTSASPTGSCSASSAGCASASPGCAGRRAADVRLLFLRGRATAGRRSCMPRSARRALWLDGGVFRSRTSLDVRPRQRPRFRRPRRATGPGRPLRASTGRRAGSALRDSTSGSTTRGGARVDLHGVDLICRRSRRAPRDGRHRPGLARHSDEVARHALDVAETDCCLFLCTAMALRHSPRHAARSRGVASITLSAWWRLGTHRLVTHDVSDWRHVDHFLTLGSGIRLPRDPVVPLRSRITPVGSAVIDARRGALPASAAPRGAFSGFRSTQRSTPTSTTRQGDVEIRGSSGAVWRSSAARPGST